jgi:hypothetical protein
MNYFDKKRFNGLSEE